MGRVYVFERGRSFKSVDAQTVGEELNRIQDAAGGTVTAERVLEAAAAADSPLHGCFTWDDTEAARKHRLNEARRVITSVRIVTPASREPVRAYVNVHTPEHGRAYLPAETVLSDDELMARFRVEFMKLIHQLERNWAKFEGAADVIRRMKSAVG